jgi:hypothetical protein
MVKGREEQEDQCQGSYLGRAVPDLDPRQDAWIRGGMLLPGREHGCGSSGLLLEERPLPHEPHHHPLHISGSHRGWTWSGLDSRHVMRSDREEHEERAVVYLSHRDSAEPDAKQASVWGPREKIREEEREAVEKRAAGRRCALRAGDAGLCVRLLLDRAVSRIRITRMGVRIGEPLVPA